MSVVWAFWASTVGVVDVEGFARTINLPFALHQFVYCDGERILYYDLCVRWMKQHRPQTVRREKSEGGTE